MKHLWTLLYIAAFVIGILLHTSGIFYDTAAMEKSDEWLKPALVVFTPAILLFIINVIAFRNAK